MDRDLPGASGCWWCADVPGRAGHRGQQFQPARTLVDLGMTGPRAAHQGVIRSQSGGRPSGGGSTSIPRFVRLDFASATGIVFYVMAALMALAAVDAATSQVAWTQRRLRFVVRL
jgi:hypothetical protein